jgi:hypothetical protein
VDEAGVVDVDETHSEDPLIHQAISQSAGGSEVNSRRSSMVTIVVVYYVVGYLIFCVVWLTNSECHGKI